MAERKAVNKYYPPSWDPSKGSINKFVGQHPLRDRARKLDKGILVIRFEMPFNIWCGKCERHIAKGVRFNAEKKVVGNYFTTKILEFSMRCASCSNVIKIQTDPKNTEYIVTSGGRRKVEDYDANEAETIEFMDDITRAKVDADPMFALDIRGAHKKQAEIDAERIQGIIEQQSVLLDDYSTTRKLRKSFREVKRAAVEEAAEAHRDYLPFPLAKGCEEDEKQASEVWFGKSGQSERSRKLLRGHARFLAPCIPISNGSTRASSGRDYKGQMHAVEVALKRNIDITKIRTLRSSKPTSRSIITPTVVRRSNKEANRGVPSSSIVDDGYMSSGSDPG